MGAVARHRRARAASAARASFDAVLELIKDKDENIRRAAIEIINTCRDKRAVDQLIEATRDSDWWVSERAADALAEIGDAKALPAMLEMVDKNNRSAARSRSRPPASSARQDPRQDPAVPAATGERSSSRGHRRRRPAGGRAASRGRAAHIQQCCARRRRDRRRAANKALQKLEGRLSPSGRYTGPRRERSRPRSAPTPAPLTAMLASPADAHGDAHGAPGAAARAGLDVRDIGSPHAARRRPREQAPRRGRPRHRRSILSALQPGDMIEGRYKFIQKIGKGAFGTVVLVEDTVVEERLILKFLNANVASDEEMLKRFVHELRYSRRITHKNVIRIYDFLYIGGSYAISMEYFPSHTLGTEIANEKPMRAGQSHRLRYRHLRRHDRRPPAGHHPSRLEAGEHPDQRRRACSRSWTSVSQQPRRAAIRN